MLSKRTEVFDVDKNYWEIFPEMRQHPLFSKYYKEDKAKTKSKSSKIMWALHLVCHPKSMMYHDPNKLDNVKGLLPKTWDWGLKSTVVDLEEYKNVMLTEAQRALVDWDDMIRKRSAYLKQQDYNLETGNDLDKLHKNTYSIYKDYQKVCDELQTEENSNLQNLSLSESGEI
tara:strand:- start:1232 stop:1747 length:516 start_codon:yes stop_codon:yes gene_type:complete